MPIDIQGQKILKKKIYLIKKLLENSKRPAILIGNGINISNTNKQLIKFARKNKIPVVSAWTLDAYPNHDKLYFGRQGSIGNRVGNYVIQMCDLVNIRFEIEYQQTSYNWKEFAKNAVKISVDIDKISKKKSN